MLKDRLSKTSDWQFHNWLFGPEKVSGLSRSEPQDSDFSVELSPVAKRLVVHPSHRLITPQASIVAYKH